MERLTKRIEDENTLLTEVGDTACKCFYDNYTLSGCWECPVGKAIEKLADYEDAEEHGLFVRLPCKLNDKLYHFYEIDFEDNFADATPDETITEVIAAEFIIDRHEITIKCIGGWNSRYEYLPVVEIGKTVFLTREEAVKKLEELKNEI